MTPKELVIRFFEEGYTNQNYDFVMKCVAQDYRDHSPAGAGSNADTVEILKSVAGQYRNFRAEVVDAFAQDSMVAARIRFDGIHSMTGRHITFEALEHFRVENGKIVESWGYWPDKEIEEKLK